MTKVKPSNGNQIESDIFILDIFKSDTFFYQNILKYFNDFQNRIFSVLSLRRTQKMEMKQNQAFFHQTYSNLTPYLTLSRNIKISQWLSKWKFLSSMTKVKSSDGNEIESDIFLLDIFNSDTFFYQNILKYFNDFQNQNFWVLSLKSTKTIDMNKIRHSSVAHIQIWHHAFYYQKILKYFNDFQNRNFSLLWLKWNQAMEMK